MAVTALLTGVRPLIRLLRGPLSHRIHSVHVLTEGLRRGGVVCRQKSPLLSHVQKSANTHIVLAN
jgi:hypothetical protein